MNKQVASRWKPGQSGNPAGRTPGARQKIVEPFYKSLHDRWLEEGESILDRLVKDEPGTVLRTIASLMPKDVAVSVEQRGPLNVDPTQWRLLCQVLDVIEQSAPRNADPVEVLQIVTDALRSHYASPVESKADTSSDYQQINSGS